MCEPTGTGRLIRHRPLPDVDGASRSHVRIRHPLPTVSWFSPTTAALSRDKAFAPLRRATPARRVSRASSVLPARAHQRHPPVHRRLPVDTTRRDKPAQPARSNAPDVKVILSHAAASSPTPRPRRRRRVGEERRAHGLSLCRGQTSTSANSAARPHAQQVDFANPTRLFGSDCPTRPLPRRGFPHVRADLDDRTRESMTTAPERSSRGWTRPQRPLLDRRMTPFVRSSLARGECGAACSTDRKSSPAVVAHLNETKRPPGV